MKSPGEAMERVVEVNRCAKVVKGGRRFSFSALVVVGDREGQVGYALGKARENADAIRKATEMARRGMIKVTMKDRTIPHEVIGRCGASRVMLKPASKGTGVIAGGGARAVLDLAGVRDVLAKSLGSASALNVVKATMDGLMQLRSREETEALRR
ncbi:MAG: 30S ribosomal protein S5 [Kiritimatiellae bacterium]|jgi:small subunit ribosomal protein S5|nr:30S ribosomal protein S5 [Kiritimatiellia bacterium]MDD3440013.1 30S ribosomal protein S5 [Kiritimatiellia bacterium]MDD4116599.1 30S ribosomal protein S5 [Kiritimatiellia bacterium]HOO20310.1 30S ribosomal protein S5 [Kiritimatiellia bacterium]HPJ56107.1 30S ribosomal protein S5 [Kiritimatiellia bacterium]